jgi:hypothetical protein
MWEFEPCPGDAARTAFIPVRSRTDPARGRHDRARRDLHAGRAYVHVHADVRGSRQETGGPDQLSRGARAGCGLAVHHPLVRLAVTRASGLELCLLDLAEVVFGQLDVCGREVLVEPVQLGRPGIGTIHRFRASSQASATCAGVAPLRSAMR